MRHRAGMTTLNNRIINRRHRHRLRGRPVPGRKRQRRLVHRHIRITRHRHRHPGRRLRRQHHRVGIGRTTLSHIRRTTRLHHRHPGRIIVRDIRRHRRAGCDPEILRCRSRLNPMRHRAGMTTLNNRIINRRHRHRLRGRPVPGRKRQTTSPCSPSHPDHPSP